MKREFLDLSTRLFAEMKIWIAESVKDDTLSVSDLAMLTASMKIIERVTLRKADIKPNADRHEQDALRELREAERR